jgi:hypothetical protein
MTVHCWMGLFLDQQQYPILLLWHQQLHVPEKWVGVHTPAVDGQPPEGLPS